MILRSEAFATECWNARYAEVRRQIRAGVRQAHRRRRLLRRWLAREVAS